MCIDPEKSYTALMRTSMGDITFELFAADAPQTVNSFVFLSRYHYYDGLGFHRIINGFVCQGGCPEGSGRGGPGYRFADETPRGPYEIGSLAMANAGPDTNGSQFFIISGDSGVQLPPLYSLFGQATDGLEVVEQMQNVRTDRADRPADPVIIHGVVITES
ncbi:MAG: peptidylprolyl isomerase [Acidimicrobiales bacterium]|nr:peptidylprolyl isomerase [Acidimicrobiales bacterium]